MALAKDSVVTPERFASGLTYQEYIAQIQRNQEKFEFNYQETKLSEDDMQAFRELVARPDGPAKVLVLGEDWCPDVFRGMAVMARIAEAAGMEMRVFPRDQNMDIMNEFLNQGEHQSIPTFVFYTRDHKCLAHWIERPALANWQRPIQMKIFEGRSREEAMPDYEKFQQGEVWAGWRQATVQEVRELLTSLYQ